MDVRFGNFALLPNKKPGDTLQRNNGLNKSFGNFATNSLTEDTFVKQGSSSSNLSFCGSDYDSLDLFSYMLGGIIESAINAYYDALINEIATRVTINGFLESFIPCVQIKGMKNFNMHYVLEMSLGGIPDLKKPKAELEKLFDDANITNLIDLRKFLNIFAAASKKCPEMPACGPEALKIYSKLQTKEDLQNFPELLLYLEGESETSPEDIDLNEYPVFIKKLGIKDERKFFTKFAHLKGAFNNFDETKDKVDAILYVKSTYDAKIKILKSIIASNPELKGENAEKIYLKAAEIIDFIYDNDPKKADEKLGAILDLAAKENRISPKTKSQIETFEDISTVEKRVAFLELLASEGITIDELNGLFKNDVISADDDYESILINRGIIIENIANAKGLSTADAKKYYSKYREILNAAFNLKDDGYMPSGIQAAIDVIDKFDIKDSKDFVNKYAAMSSPAEPAKKAGAKNKKQSYTPAVAKMSASQAMEAIRILSFADEDLAGEFVKGKKFPILNELKHIKQEFETLLPEIEQLLTANENPFISGKSPFEIFIDYKKLAADGEDLKSFIGSVEIFKTTDSLEYASSAVTYNDFAQYFPDKKTTNAFLLKNGIKLDSSNGSSAYRENCLRILNALDKKEDGEYFEKLCQSDFIKNSKSGLSIFLSKIEKTADLNTVIKIILDKDIQTIDEIMRVIRLYAGEDGKCDKVFEHLQKTSDDINPREYLAALDKIQSSFVQGGIPVKIDNGNISAIDNEYLRPGCKLTQYRVSSLANKLSHNNGENIVSSLERAFTDKKMNASAYTIALEIISRARKSDESYQNILRELDLPIPDKDLNDSVTKAECVYAVAKALPKEFVDFVNNGKWLDFNGDGKYPNMRLHARIRMIDRFALDEEGSIKKLYTKETQEKLKGVLRTVYTSDPVKFIKCQKDEDRFEAQFAYGDSGNINAVFCNTGEMITIVKH